MNISVRLVYLNLVQDLRILLREIACHSSPYCSWPHLTPAQKELVRKTPRFPTAAVILSVLDVESDRPQADFFYLEEEEGRNCSSDKNQGRRRQDETDAGRLQMDSI